MVTLLASTWMTENTLVATAGHLRTILDELTEIQWRGLFYWLRRGSYLGQIHEERTERLEIDGLPEQVSPRVASILALRADALRDQAFFHKYFKEPSGNDSVSVEFVLLQALDLPRFGTESWNPDLKSIQKCYALGQAFEPGMIHFPLRQGESGQMPLELAQRIIKEADRYPAFMVTLSEERCRRAVASKIVPVVRVAERDRWFTSS